MSEPCTFCKGKGKRRYNRLRGRRGRNILASCSDCGGSGIQWRKNVMLTVDAEWVKTVESHRKQMEIDERKSFSFTEAAQSLFNNGLYDAEQDYQHTPKPRVRKGNP